jgi:hypothetical protein
MGDAAISNSPGTSTLNTSAANWTDVAASLGRVRAIAADDYGRTTAFIVPDGGWPAPTYVTTTPQAASAPPGFAATSTRQPVATARLATMTADSVIPCVPSKAMPPVATVSAAPWFPPAAAVTVPPVKASVAKPSPPASTDVELYVVLLLAWCVVVGVRVAVVRGWFRRRRPAPFRRGFEVAPPRLPNGDRLLRVTVRRVGRRK